MPQVTELVSGRARIQIQLHPAIRPVLLVTLTPGESVVPKLQVNWDGLLEVQALGERVFAKRLL